MLFKYAAAAVTYIDYIPLNMLPSLAVKDFAA